jgi:hypothetical protein
MPLSIWNTIDLVIFVDRYNAKIDEKKSLGHPPPLPFSLESVLDIPLVSLEERKTYEKLRDGPRNNIMTKLVDEAVMTLLAFWRKNRGEEFDTDALSEELAGVIREFRAL